MREQTGIAINIVAVLQSLHHFHRQTIMAVATGDVGVVKLPPAHHAHFLYVKITTVYVISMHKNSNRKNMLFEMHQYDIKKMSL